jgi:hypothetical protein
MNIHEHTWAALGCWPNSTGKPERSRRGHHYGETLTKVISILNLRSWDWHASAGNQTWAIGGEHCSKELFEKHINNNLEHVHLGSKCCKVCNLPGTLTSPTNLRPRFVWFIASFYGFVAVSRILHQLTVLQYTCWENHTKSHIGWCII